MQPPPLPDLEEIREVVQELYGQGLRQVGHPKFYKPYTKAINRENPYLRVIEFLNSLYPLEKMESPPLSMWLDS